MQQTALISCLPVELPLLPSGPVIQERKHIFLFAWDLSEWWPKHLQCGVQAQCNPTGQTTADGPGDAQGLKWGGPCTEKWPWQV